MYSSAGGHAWKNDWLFEQLGVGLKFKQLSWAVTSCKQLLRDFFYITTHTATYSGMWGRAPLQPSDCSSPVSPPNRFLNPASVYEFPWAPAQKITAKARSAKVGKYFSPNWWEEAAVWSLFSIQLRGQQFQRSKSHNPLIRSPSGGWNTQNAQTKQTPCVFPELRGPRIPTQNPACVNFGKVKLWLIGCRIELQN